MQTAEKISVLYKTWWRWCGEDKLTLSNNILHNLNGLIKLSGLHLDWVDSHFQLLNYQTKKKVLWVWPEPSPVLNTAFLFYVRKICETELQMWANDPHYCTATTRVFCFCVQHNWHLCAHVAKQWIVISPFQIYFQTFMNFSPPGNLTGSWTCAYVNTSGPIMGVSCVFLVNDWLDKAS